MRYMKILQVFSSVEEEADGVAAAVLGYTMFFIFLEKARAKKWLKMQKKRV